MKSKGVYILFVIITIGVLIRLRGINDPYIHAYDSCFQEGMALNHLKYGYKFTHGLSVTGKFDDKAIYHLSHPPLLQNIYANLYRIFGVKETVARSFSLIAWTFTAIFIYLSLHYNNVKKEALLTVMIFAIMPLSVCFSTTTNYEPLSLMLISLIYLCALKSNKRKWQVCGIIASIFGALTDWPVCLSGVAIIITFWKNNEIRKYGSRLLVIIGTITIIQFINAYLLMGKIPVLSHSKTRSSFDVFMDPIKSFSEPVLTIITKAWPIILIILLYLVLKKLKIGLIKLIITGKDKASLEITAVSYWGVMIIIYIILAGQLVSVHPISLYYTVPFLSIAGGTCLGRIPKKISVVLGCITVIFSTYFILYNKDQTNSFYYDLAKRLNQNGNGSVYSAAAVGYYKFYYGMETMYPLGSNELGLEYAVLSKKVKYVVIDEVNTEVQYLSKISKKMEQEKALYLLFDHPAARVFTTNQYNKKKLGEVYLFNMLNLARWEGPKMDSFEKPEVDYLTLIDESRFGIYQHPPRNGKSSLMFENIEIPNGSSFKTWLGMARNCMDSEKGDGVEFGVNLQKNGVIYNIYNRQYDPKNDIKQRRFIAVNVELVKWWGDNVNIILETYPLKDYTYDKAFWGEPGIYVTENINEY